VAKQKHWSAVFHKHSLSIVSISILLLWIVLYLISDPETHWGSFFGNAIADWSGLVVMVLATKYLFEKGSKESRKPPKDPGSVGTLRIALQNHSLTIFLIITGLFWIALFARMAPNGKWGQVVGNIVSEWTQIFGVVLLTKKLMEVKSKE
jgi:hypothetical protein